MNYTKAGCFIVAMIGVVVLGYLDRGTVGLETLVRTLAVGAIATFSYAAGACPAQGKTP